METSDRKVTGSWASKKTTPVVALVIDLLIVTWPELRASSPHIRPLVGEVWSNFKNRLRILENGSHGNERNILPPLVTRGFPYRPLPGSWGMLVEITVSGMIFQETAIKTARTTHSSRIERDRCGRTDWNDIHTYFYARYYIFDESFDGSWNARDWYTFISTRFPGSDTLIERWSLEFQRKFTTDLIQFD